MSAGAQLRESETAPLLAALRATTRYQRRRLAVDMGVADRQIDDWARRSTLDTLAPWLRRELARKLGVRPPRTPFRRALIGAEFEQLQRIAGRLGISVAALRRRAGDGWQPPPMQCRQIAIALGRDVRELFPDPN